jgi:hypothetical protein
MIGPGRYLTRMGLFLLAVAALVAVLFPALLTAFAANVALNATIVGVLVLGVLYVFRQVLLLRPEVRWLETYRRREPGLSVQASPRLLAPVATMLGERGARVTLTATATRSLLDSIRMRLDEGRDISRYMIGLLVFLGLLGTFWGLLETISSIGTVIGGLGAGSGDVMAFFDELKAGLKAPLGGMGTAFSSSMLGLAGSLVLGFLDLQASQAQNRFYQDLEEWLSSLTRVGSAPALLDDSEPHVPAYLQALIERTAESLESLQRTIARGEENRKGGQAQLVSLAERVSALTDQIRAEQSLLVKLTESQSELKPAIARLAESTASSVDGDEVTRAHIRSIEVYLMRLLDELTSGRNQISEEVRGEIRLLTRTIAALGEENQSRRTAASAARRS